MDRLEAHLAARSGHGVQLYVPFLRACRLHVPRRVGSGGAAPPPVPRVRALLPRMRSLSHVHVEAVEAWTALSPQPGLTDVFVDLGDGQVDPPATAADVYRVAADPATVKVLGGNLALSAGSAGVWRRFSRLETLQVHRPDRMRLGDVAPFREAWPGLTRLVIRQGVFTTAALPEAWAAFVAAVVRGREPGTVTLEFRHQVPHSPMTLDGSRLHLAALHADRASPPLLWWMRRVLADHVVINSWDPQARMAPSKVLHTLVRNHGAQEVVLHGVDLVLHGQPAVMVLPTAAKPCRVAHVRVHLSRAQTELQMRDVDQLAQCAALSGRATFSFVPGQAAVDVAVQRLRARLPLHEVLASTAHVVECRRL